ncbi:unnamed protein product [Effrenium voratum]|nr:unnamed protein product [Effrenium voratum]
MCGRAAVEYWRQLVEEAKNFKETQTCQENQTEEAAESAAQAALEQKEAEDQPTEAAQQLAEDLESRQEKETEADLEAERTQRALEDCPAKRAEEKFVVKNTFLELESEQGPNLQQRFERLRRAKTVAAFSWREDSAARAAADVQNAVNGHVNAVTGAVVDAQAWLAS